MTQTVFYAACPGCGDLETKTVQEGEALPIKERYCSPCNKWIPYNEAAPGPRGPIGSTGPAAPRGATGPTGPSRRS